MRLATLTRRPEILIVYSGNVEFAIHSRHLPDIPYYFDAAHAEAVRCARRSD